MYDKTETYSTSALCGAPWPCGAALALSGCGGGGGSGAATASSAGPRAGLPPRLAYPETPQTGFFTSEFSSNLDQINAESAYARGATGAGVTVAIVDYRYRPVSPRSSRPNLSPASTDIVTGDPISDEDGHGTAVAGIVQPRQETAPASTASPSRRRCSASGTDDRSAISTLRRGRIVALMDEQGEPANSSMTPTWRRAIDYAVANGASVSST